MKVWLVKVGEPLPIPGNESARSLRTGQLAHYLLQRGAKVTWWSSTFDHVQKTHHFSSDQTVKVTKNYQLRLIKSFGYQRNISIRRGLDDYMLSSKMLAQMNATELPDVIYCAYPPVFLAKQVIKFAKTRGIPSLLDARDLWPDIFYEAAPNLLKPVGYCAYLLQKPTASSAFSNCTAISGITEDYLNWGLQYAGRSQNSDDRVFPLGARKKQLSADVLEQSYKFWSDHDVHKHTFNIVFCGVLTDKIDLTNTIEAIKNINNSNIRLAICGTGQQLDNLKTLAASDPRIVFPGWINEPQLLALMSISDIGLAPYKNRLDFMRSIPSKVAEYMAFGVPYLSSLKGQLEKFTATNNTGYFCEERDVASLKNQIIECINGEFERKKKAKAAEELYNTTFNSDMVYSTMADHLMSLGEKYSTRLDSCQALAN